MIDGLKPYQATKDSGVTWLGQVPEHWEVQPALAIYRPKMVKNIGMQEKTVLSLSYGRIVVKPPEKLHGLVPESFETYQIVDPGNIIVRTTDLQNDKVSLRVGHAQHRGIITSAYMCLETTARVSSEFGYQFLNVYDLLKIIYGFGSGLRQNLDFADIKRMPILVPPLIEQNAIVRFLHHADRQIARYIRAKQKLINLLEEEKRVVVHHAVTRGLDANVKLKPSGIEWLGEAPKHWQVRALIRACTERADYRGATPNKTESGVFLVTAKNIRPGYIDYECSKEYVSPSEYDWIMRRGRPRIGDLLFTTEAPLGNFALVDREDIALAQRVIRFRLDETLAIPAFALHSVLSPYFQSQLLCRATGSTAHGIKASKLPQLMLLLPPVPEQVTILNWLENETNPQDAAIDRARKEIALLREYRTRLIADVVTGKLDAREAAARLPQEVPGSEPLDEIQDLDEDEESTEDEELEAEETV
jgi:type I restriction enzyme S subunit